jgi:hypothetical protein
MNATNKTSLSTKLDSDDVQDQPFAWYAAQGHQCIPDDAKKLLQAVQPWNAAMFSQPLFKLPQLGSSEKDMLQVLQERDDAIQMADDLAAQIAAITEIDIGEHTSGNDPHQAAMLVADEFIASRLKRLAQKLWGAL